MRKRIILAIAVALSIQRPQSARAAAFATEWTQLLNHGQLVMQYIRQGEELTKKIQMYEDMVRQAARLPSQVFGSINSDLRDLASIVQGGRALAYSLSNLDAQFRGVFTGYGTYPGSYYPNYKKWSETTLDTTLGVLKAAGLQGSQLANEESVLDSVRGMLQSADGRMEMLQAMGQVAENQVQQLMKLRQIMLADLTSKQAYQAAVIQKEAASEAAIERFFNSGTVTSDGRTFRAVP